MLHPEIAGVNNAKALLKNFIDKEDVEKIENFCLNTHENTVKSVAIVNNAIAYLLSRTAVEALRYVLDY